MGKNWETDGWSILYERGTATSEPSKGGRKKVGYVAGLFVLVVAGYTMVYAWDAWQAKNRLGAVGLTGLTLVTTGLSFYLLFIRK